MTRTTNLALSLLVLAAAPAVSAATCEAPPWQQLEFRASKFFLTARATLTASTAPAEAVADDLSDDATGCLAPGRCVTVLLQEADVPGGRDSVETAYLDSTAGAVLQTEKVTGGSDAYRKFRRYTATGWEGVRSEPATDSERSLAPARWSRRALQSERWVPALPRGGVVTSSSALLWLVSVADLDEAGRSVARYVYADGRLVEVRLVAGGLREMDVDVETDGIPAPIRGRRTVREVTVAAREHGDDPSGDGSDIDLDFMGMKGDLVIRVDVETGVPLEMVGRTPYIGELRVKLESVRF